MSLTDKDLIAISRLLERSGHRAEKQRATMEARLEKKMTSMETRLSMQIYEQKQNLIKRIDELDYHLTSYIEGGFKKLSSVTKRPRGTLKT